jgi:hypothetical protein
MDILRTDFTDLLPFHTCPEIFIFLCEWNVSGGTIEIATVISVIVEELRFEWYWFTAIYLSARPRQTKRRVRTLIELLIPCGAICRCTGPKVLINLLIVIKDSIALLATSHT